MPATDLATLAQVSSWIPNVPTSGNDNALLSSLITSASQAILSDIQRQTVLSQTYTEVYNGYGEVSKMLRKWPTTSVASVTIGRCVVPVRPAGQFYGCGYTFEAWDGELPGKPQLINVLGYEFCCGIQNIQIVYTAGYFVSNEAWVVPVGGGTVTAAQLNGPWAKDGGVTYASSGIALTLVTGAPNTGQYSVALGIYTFALGDAGAALLGNYSYIPAPLNQACMEMVGEAYRYRNRIGERSHTTPGPQTTAYDLSRMTAAIKMMINPFRMVVPLI